MTIIKTYRPDGEVRQIHADALADSYAAAGADIRRASNVEPVPAGPFRLHFYVDFSPLFETTGNPEHLSCLRLPCKTRAEALRKEMEWLMENYVRS